jgi:hypothetical protein
MERKNPEPEPQAKRSGGGRKPPSKPTAVAAADFNRVQKAFEIIGSMNVQELAELSRLTQEKLTTR